MERGAHTPEELEMLLEDAFVMHDPERLARLFDDYAVLVSDPRLDETLGIDPIRRLVASMWGRGHTYFARPQRVVQSRDVALVIGDRDIHVVRRGDDGTWRYAIFLLGLDDHPFRSRGWGFVGHRHFG